MSLSARPLSGAARLAWLDGPPQDVSTIADVLQSGRRAVVSLTDASDVLTRADLYDLLAILDRTDQVEFIACTMGWFDPSSDPPVDLRVLRMLASASALTLGLVCTHQTGLVRVRGTSICWDYTCGTPHFIASVKTRGDVYTLPQHHIIGVNDWLLRAKAARSIPPHTIWEDFIGGKPD